GNRQPHGMWHSVWEGGYWSRPIAIAIGEVSADWDPNFAHAVLSQGNVLLVTWMNDWGNMKPPSGATWYSYTVLDSPELPVVPLPMQKPLPIDAPSPTQLIDVSTPTPEYDLLSMDSISPPTDKNPIDLLAPGIITAFLLLLLIVGLFVFSRPR
ncbi:unnamed protein product, partial [marine sediment metagenome]